jgi:deoxyribodipyrimidine photo-lyase
MKTSASLVWFRLDLRVADNPALHAAIKRGGPIVPVFIYAPDEEAPWTPGAASKWWLHQSLSALKVSLSQTNSRLIIHQGRSLESLQELVRKTGAGAVFWNRRYEPALIQRDAKIKEILLADGIVAESFNGALLNEPWTIKNSSGKPFQVFTAFWRNCLSQPTLSGPLPAPRKLQLPRAWPESLSVDTLKLEPEIKWAEGIRAVWHPGEAGAHSRLKCFLKTSLADYRDNRNLPAQPGTSRLSPHLHFGEITPRQIWFAMRRQAESRTTADVSWKASPFLTEIGWREFSHHLLFHFPQMPAEPLRQEFKRFPWRKSPEFLTAWQKGLTGYPIVDAGMRELWTTGWMHNRVRMIVASFLTKDLLVSWVEGARWFWDTLVDADLAQNTLGWQWTAGCAADAAPYFRVFNPVAQGEKFDPQGQYVRQWCPELARLPDKWVHRPWEAPAAVCSDAAVELGRTYPAPMVSHTIAREVALEAFSKIKQK